MTQGLERNTRRVRSALNLCAIGLLSALLGYLLLDVWHQYRYGRQSTQWPTIEATLSSAEAMPTGTRGVYALNVAYEYVIDGQTYQGDRYRFHPQHGNHTECSAIAANLLANPAVSVSYSPSDPSISVMRPGITLGELLENAIATILGSIVLIGFLAAFAVDLVKVLRSPPACRLPSGSSEAGLAAVAQ